MSKGLSLHIGLNAVDPNHYEGWAGRLVACEADADDMHAIATARKFTATQLLTAAATRDAVTAALHEAAQQLEDGDILLVTYSGHGGQIPDSNDDEADGMDETWCLYDGELIDDELHALFARFAAGVRIVMVSDSCHSGTVARDAFHSVLRSTGVLAAMTGSTDGAVPAFRQMPDDVALRVYRKHRELYVGRQGAVPRDVRAQVRASVLLISGCQDNQFSADGAYNGLFTGKLLQVWNKGLFAGGYRDFHKAIVARMPPTQTPNFYQVGAVNPALMTQSPFSI